MDIVRRLKIYMEHVGLPSTQFADYAKIARPTISQLLNGRNRKVSNELLEKLHDAFPDLNILWLMFGDGEMLVNAPQKHPAQPTLFEPSAPSAQFASNMRKDTPVRTSNIDEFVVDNSRNKPVDKAQTEKTYVDQATETATNVHYDAQASVQIPVTQNNEMSKRIKSIMVFYSDSSFEIFTPSQL